MRQHFSDPLRCANPMRVRALVCAIALILPACSGFVRHGSTAPVVSHAPTGYGSGRSIPPVTRVQDPKTKGILEVSVVDDQARPIPGATVEYRGPSGTGRVSTDSRGALRVTLRAGSYELTLLPCGPGAIALDQRKGDVSIVQGTTIHGVLSGARWKPRFGPTQSGDFSRAPPWAAGERVRLRVEIQDGCTFKAAPGAPLSSYRWRASKNFAFMAQPATRADAAGYAHVDVRCTASGNGDVTLYNSLGTDEVNLLDLGSAPGSGHTFCER